MRASHPDLAGRVAIVTGASRGIGKGSALVLAALTEMPVNAGGGAGSVVGP